VILVIGANAGVIGMSKEHLAVALALSVPIVVCVTKVSKTSLLIVPLGLEPSLDHRWI
jgi:GTPase